MRTAKTLIRLGGRSGCSESSLGAHSFCLFCHVAAHLFSLFVVIGSLRSMCLALHVHLLCLLLFEPPHDKTNKMASAPSEDSHQPGYPPSQISVFAVRMK